MYRKRNNIMEILALYTSDYNKQLYLREISKLTKIPLKTTQNTLKILEDAKIFRGSVRGKNKYFSLNLDNVQTKLHLVQAELHRTSMFLGKYPQFKLFLKNIDTNAPIIVFGSFAKFTANNSSDVDLLTISRQKLPFHLLPNKVHQIKMSERNFTKSLIKQETLIKEIEKNHVILNNHSFYINTLWRFYEKQQA
jgi:predicted nucleotidyltransferase